MGGPSQGFAQDKGGQMDPTQLQRDRELLDLNPIEKPKPEYEILTPLEQMTPPSEGVVIVPDEPHKPPMRSLKDKEEPAKEKEESVKKEDDY